jgi:hypothetical protein
MVALGELLVVTAVAAIIGKALGLARARARFQWATRELLGQEPGRENLTFLLRFRGRT